MIELKERSYNSYRCNTSGNHQLLEGHNELRILDTFILNSNELVDYLCVDDDIARRYSEVSVFWQHRDKIDLRELLNLEIDFFLAKPELLQRIELVEKSGYIAVASYPSYTSGFISVYDKPELVEAYFRDKRLGLIDDPSSLSGYQIPKAILHKEKIDDKLLNVVLYKSHDQLYEALFSGEVDVIASFVPDEKDPVYSKVKILPLQEQLLGPKWYLHPALLDTSIHCGIVEGLRRFTQDHVNRYIAAVKIIRDCTDVE